MLFVTNNTINMLQKKDPKAVAIGYIKISSISLQLNHQTIQSMFHQQISSLFVLTFL